jgi:ubiquinone/menaquinone biosynthesis C-methylase UbiE
MASALNQFNSVSAIYDLTARLFFGSTLHDAQCHFISAIPDESKILILGGGTGKFLEALLLKKPDVKVIYVEASSNMILRARSTVSDDRRVTFVYGTQDSIPNDLKADVIITPFFLDLFTDQSLKKVIATLKSASTLNGIWIATDFSQSDRISHRLLLWVMYRFFRIASRIESKQLPAWADHLSKAGRELEAKTFKNGFVKTVLYKINE